MKKGKTGRVELPPTRVRELASVAKKVETEEKDELTAWGKRVLDEHEELMAVLKMLKAERERQGLTLDAMAERTGIAKGNLSKLESGRAPNPTIQTLHRIADALGRSIRVRLA